MEIARADGQQIKSLTIVDECARDGLTFNVAGSIRPRRLIAMLAQMISMHGAPRYLHSDDGSKFFSRAILEWLPLHRNNDLETGSI